MVDMKSYDGSIKVVLHGYYRYFFGYLDIWNNPAGIP